MKYKVGDKVKVRKDLVVGKLYYMCDKTRGNLFVEPMSKWAGCVVEISEIIADQYKVKGGDWWSWVDEMFEPVNTQKIVITTDGVETLARLYEGDKVVKKATAKCSPDDTFDFNVGAKIAFERLMNEEKKPLTFREKLRQEHPEKVFAEYGGGCFGCPKDFGYESEKYCKNELQDCTKCWDRVIPEDKAKKKGEKPFKFEVGKQYIGFNVKGDELVIKITRQDNKRSIIKYYYEIVRGKDYGYDYFQEDSEFAKRFKPYDPPKYYNGKVVCVGSTGSNERLYTVGKIYQFVDGQMTCDDGSKMPCYKHIKNFREWDKFSSSDFVEIVE